jgi:uncharacterized protein
MTMPNPFVHAESNTTDTAKAKTFYGQLFGWKLTDIALRVGTYTMIDVGEGTGGGIMQQVIPGASSAWMPYVLVDDIKAATAQAKALGASIMKDVDEVPDMGRLSIIEDPTGAMLGLWQAKM